MFKCWIQIGRTVHLLNSCCLELSKLQFHVEHLIHSDRLEETRVWHASGQISYFALVHCYLPCSNISAIYNLLYLSLILTRALIYYFNHLFAHWYYILFIYILFVILSREMWSWVYMVQEMSRLTRYCFLFSVSYSEFVCWGFFCLAVYFKSEIPS